MIAFCLFAILVVWSCGRVEENGLNEFITRGEQIDSTFHITVLTDTTWADTHEYEY